MRAEHVRLSQLRTISWWQSLRGNVDDLIGIYNDTLHLYTWYGEPGIRIVAPMKLLRFHFNKVKAISQLGSFQVIHGGHQQTIQGISLGSANFILRSDFQELVISLRPKSMVFVTMHHCRFCWKFQYMDLPETVLQVVRPVCCGW